MLDRPQRPPPKPPPSPAAARARERRRARKARYRQRKREHKMAVIVTLDGDGINWLVHGARCLAEADAGDRGEIGAAISRAIQVSARK